LWFKDVDGKTPLHIAIENQHHTIISLLLSHPVLNLSIRDKAGATPFAAAMTVKNNRAAQAILDREPTAAEQVPCILIVSRLKLKFSSQPTFLHLMLKNHVFSCTLHSSDFNLLSATHVCTCFGSCSFKSKSVQYNVRLSIFILADGLRYF